MKNIICIVCLLFYSICNAQINKVTNDKKQQYASLGNFKLDNGNLIEDCHIGYRTYGKLNPAKNNCILFSTWFGGTTYDLEQFVPGKIVDTCKYFLVLVDAFGNGISSSPSNSATQSGSKFPLFSIKDMVESQYLLLTKFLGIQHLRAVFGISMGGMQAFQWSVSYPSFEDYVVSVVGTPRQTSYDLARWYFLLDNLQSRVASNSYDEVSKAREENFLNYFLITNAAKQASNISRDSFNILISEFHGKSPADWNKNLDKSKADWNNQISQVKAMISLDVSKPFNESFEKTAANVKTKFIIIVVKQDQVVNPASAIEFAKFVHAKLFIQDSELGHMGANLKAEEVKKAFGEIFSG